MPLGGIWATAPFMHNQSIGDWAPADATPAERAVYFADAMYELMSDTRTPKINPYVPAFSTPPGSSTPLCSDTVLNRGHTFGASLSNSDKDALIYWLQYQ